MRTRTLVTAAFLVVAFVAYLLGSNSGGPTPAEVETSIRHELADYAYESCHEDRRLRLQYKDRARALDRFARQEEKVNKALIEVVHEFQREGGAGSLQSIPRLGEVLDKVNVRLIQIQRIVVPLPVRSCERTRDRIISNG